MMSSTSLWGLYRRQCLERRNDASKCRARGDAGLDADTKWRYEIAWGVFEPERRAALAGLLGLPGRTANAACCASRFPPRPQTLDDAASCRIGRARCGWACCDWPNNDALHGDQGA